MLVIAVDPSMKNIGVAVFQDDKLAVAKCLHKNPVNELCDLIESLPEKPDLFAYEAYNGGKNYHAVKGGFLSKGWMQMAARAYKIPVCTVTPHEVKFAMAGRKMGVSKDEVIAIAEKMYPYSLPRSSTGRILKKEAEHVADAIGVYHAYKLKYNKI